MSSGVGGDRALQGRDRGLELAHLPLQEAELLQGQRHVGSLGHDLLRLHEGRAEVARLVEGHDLLDLGVEADEALGIVGVGVARLSRRRG